MSQSLFFLGREPKLSVGELEMALNGIGELSWSTPLVALVESDRLIGPDFLRRLGGSIKQAVVLEFVDGIRARVVEKRLTADRVAELLGPDGRDIGLSVYGANEIDSKHLARVVLQRKKELRTAGRSIRIVTSREPQLSAVTVQRQGLLRQGVEVVVVKHDQGWIVGRTVAVQDFHSYGLRDFGRPAADAKSGMLPPKVAQMMLNLAEVKADDTLLDPFCGSGTILQEAALRGVKKIYGSDVSPKAVKDSQQNLRWFLQAFPEVQADIDITGADVRQGSVRPTVIVTEPFLGKPLHGNESEDTLRHEGQQIRALYIATFQAWAKQLAPGGRVVMVWPQVYHAELGQKLLQEISALGFEPQPLLRESTANTLRVADPFVLDYGREQARVRRDIRKWVFSPEK